MVPLLHLSGMEAEWTSHMTFCVLLLLYLYTMLAVERRFSVLYILSFICSSVLFQAQHAYSSTFLTPAHILIRKPP